MLVFHADSPGRLGRWHLFETSLSQLLTALRHPHRSHATTARVYPLDGSWSTGVEVPAAAEPQWNDERPDQMTPDQASDRLAGGAAVQIFLFNGDSDCVRHYLVLPLPEPVFWLP